MKLLPSSINDPPQLPRYISLTEANVVRKKDVVRSKILHIKKLSVTITQQFDEDVDFVIETEPGVLSDDKTIPELDICAREDVVFDEDITKGKLESIIRRCGILDKYKEYFVSDPEIVIDEYELSIKKSYRYFNEFKEGILIGGDIFV